MADPNGLFFCGDTAQTIARGIGFRFADIQTLFFNENARRKDEVRRRLEAEAAEEAARLTAGKASADGDDGDEG